jgi:succinyl-CoA synthetase beta subunit
MRRFATKSRQVPFTRALNIHEYSSKQFLRDAGCKVEYGIMCETLAQVEEACKKIASPQKVVKSQILAGGRGKGKFLSGFQGGVHVCANSTEALATAGKMLGQTLVTKQTGPAGLKVSKLFVTECVPKIKKEYYVALLLDRGFGGPVFVASTEGGMDIETVAHNTPDKIVKMPINVQKGMTKEDGVALAAKLGLRPQAGEQFYNIYNFAKTKDATMVEINPFVELENGDYMCIDAKISFDDNATFRQKDVWAHEDLTQKDPREVEAAKWDLNYVGLDGNVGCLVNGAGLAMATMDIISMYGGSPANFLDVGGSAKADQVAAALDIIQKDAKVKGILINIFGGIMKCDVIAQGVVDACRKITLRVPLVVRLSGTNADLGKQILKDSNLPLAPAGDLDEAARKIMDLINKK